MATFKNIIAEIKRAIKIMRCKSHRYYLKAIYTNVDNEKSTGVRGTHFTDYDVRNYDVYLECSRCGKVLIIPNMHFFTLIDLLECDNPKYIENIKGYVNNSKSQNVMFYYLHKDDMNYENLLGKVKLSVKSLVQYGKPYNPNKSPKFK